MVYEVPASKASISQNVFEFHLPESDTTHRLPLMRYIKASLLTEMQEISGPLRGVIASGGTPSPEESEALAGIQRKILEFYCPGVYDEGDLEQMSWIFRAWGEASNPDGADVELGESSPSA